MPVHLIERKTAHPSKISRLQFLQGTPRLISESGFKNICLWDWQTGILITEFDGTYRHPIVPPAKDRFILQHEGHFKIFESKTGKFRYVLPQHEAGLHYSGI